MMPLDVPRVPAWMSDATCASADPDAWFPPIGGRNTAAKAICATCPVIDTCRDYALGDPDLMGIWGGMSEMERRRARRAA